jgi:glycine cleavage system regulatory protein
MKMRVLVLTVIGEDRPGLVEALARLISDHEGSWNESRMARLAGHFAGVVQIHLPERRADELIAALPGLAERGLQASVTDSDASLATIDRRDIFRLELVGQDRPGIIREISSALSALGVSVQDLRTVVESAAMSGERLFRAYAELVPPPDVELERVRAALERLADELMVDVTLEAGHSD